MARFHSIPALACAIALPLALPLALGGCVGVAVVGGLGAAAGGGYAAAQERGVTGAVDDFAIKTDVDQGLMKAELQLHGNSITTTVYDGRVLLTGRVASPELKTPPSRSPARPMASARSMTRSRWRRRKG